MPRPVAHRPVAAIRVEDFTVEHVYPSVSEAARAKRVSYQRVWTNATGHREAKSDGYIVLFTDDMDVVDKMKRDGYRRYQKPLDCYDRITETSTRYRSARQAADDLGVSIKSVRNSVLYNCAVLSRYEFSPASSPA